MIEVVEGNGLEAVVVANRGAVRPRPVPIAVRGMPNGVNTARRMKLSYGSPVVCAIICSTMP